MAWKLYISKQARADIQELWENGLAEFGLKVADDYDLLIQQALADLLDDPYRIGASLVENHAHDLYIYPLMHSKARAQGKIKRPAHAVFYFIINGDTVAIASIARPSRELHIGNLDLSGIEREIDVEQQDDES